MANVDGAFGLRPLRKLDGSPYCGQFVRCNVPSSDSTALFIGDPVNLAGAATAAGPEEDPAGVPTVKQAAAGEAIFGVVVGFEANRSDLEQVHRAASTERMVQVVVDPQMVYAVQADDDMSTIAAADVGMNANIIVAAGDTATGLSGVELDSDTIATTAALPLKLLGIHQQADNEAYSANQICEVVINNSQIAGGTGTVGFSA